MHLADLNDPHPASDDHDGDYVRHVRCIETLAEELHCQAQDIAPLYEEVLTSLSGARITDYVPIFVCLRVKRILSRRHVSS